MALGLHDELNRRLAGKKILVLGVGNRLRGDDAVGPKMIERLSSRIDVPMIDAGDVPENYLGPIEASNVDLVLIIDAVDLKTAPGEVGLIELDRLTDWGLSSHTANLSLLFQAIPVEKRPAALLLGIQPASTEFLAGISEPVSSSMDRLEELIVSLSPLNTLL